MEKITKVCHICKSEFNTTIAHRYAKFCSHKCYQKWHRTNNPEKWKHYKATYRSKEINKEKEREWKKKYWSENRDAILAKKREIRKETYVFYKDSLNEKRRVRREIDPEYREKDRLAKRKQRENGYSDKVKTRRKIDKLNSIKNLRDDYIRDLLCQVNPSWRGKKIPKTIIEEKKLALKIKRLAHEKQRKINTSRDNGRSI
jgi:hypothetical protein